MLFPPFAFVVDADGSHTKTVIRYDIIQEFQVMQGCRDLERKVQRALCEQLDASWPCSQVDMGPETGLGEDHGAPQLANMGE